MTLKFIAYKRMERAFSKSLSVPCLAEGKANELAPRVLRLAAGARILWIAFADSIERQLAPDGALCAVKGIANILPGHAARLAEVMTLVSGQC